MGTLSAKRIIIIIIAAVSTIACTGNSKSEKKINMENVKETLVRLKTTMGDITVKLYDETPKHRDNFIKLVKEGAYDSTLFHRVIKNFMIQAGDPLSKTATDTTVLGSGDVGYTIPAEFNKNFFHKKGALAAARRADNADDIALVYSAVYAAQDLELAKALAQVDNVYELCVFSCVCHCVSVPFPSV